MRDLKRIWPMQAIGLALILSVALIGALSVRAAEPTGEAIVRCNPANPTGTTTTPLSFEIYVQNVVDLYGADVRFGFDTTLASVVDANTSASGVQFELLDSFLKPDFVVRNVADNTAGTIWYASTQVNPSQAVSGSGPLARVTFQPKGPGTFTIPITYKKLVMQTGIEIPSVAQGCTVTFIADPPPSSRQVYLSPKAAVTMAGVPYATNDVLRWSEPGNQWALTFDGSTIPLTKNAVAFARLGDGSMLMSFSVNQNITIGGVTQTFTPWDVARYFPATNTWAWYLDGSDVGLTTAAEKIDALAVNPAGRLVLSTVGTASVPCTVQATLCPANKLSAPDEDLIAFNGTTGAISSGVWSRVLDGSIIAGLAAEDVVGASIDNQGNLYISLLDAFSVAGVRGTGKDILRLSPSGASYQVTLYWNALAAGYPGTLDAIEVKP